MSTRSSEKCWYIYFLFYLYSTFRLLQSLDLNKSSLNWGSYYSEVNVLVFSATALNCQAGIASWLDNQNFFQIGSTQWAISRSSAHDKRFFLSPILIRVKCYPLQICITDIHYSDSQKHSFSTHQSSGGIQLSWKWFDFRPQLNV